MWRVGLSKLARHWFLLPLKCAAAFAINRFGREDPGLCRRENHPLSEVAIVTQSRPFAFDS
jgi:hypothetical protein